MQNYSKKALNKAEKIILKIITLLIPVLFFLLMLQKNRLSALACQLPACPFHAIYGLYCPACGNTRSIIALLHGRFITSLRYNITPFLLMLLGLGAYIELITLSFGKFHAILPRKQSFYIILTILWIIYLIVRNLIPGLMP
jgi:hypothetical protein